MSTLTAGSSVRRRCFGGNSAAEVAFLNATPETIDEARETLLAGSSGHATMSDWFFQMVFVATTASIISGTLAERVRLWSFFLFVAVLSAFIYPVVGAWTWGGGWLSEMGFQDFAGSTIVHSTGGWAALSGAMLIGARRGRFRKDGTIRQMPPSSVPIVTLGVFIHWLGWFGFNGGSQLALSSATDALALSNIFANTNIAASAGVVAAPGPVQANPGTHGPSRNAERSNRRARGNYCRAGSRQPPVGDPDRRDWRRHHGCRNPAAGDGASMTAWVRYRPTCLPASGERWPFALPQAETCSCS